MTKTWNRVAAPVLVLFTTGALAGCTAGDPAELCPLDETSWSDVTGDVGGVLTYSELGYPECGYVLDQDDIDRAFAISWQPDRSFDEVLAEALTDRDAIPANENHPDRQRSLGSLGPNDDNFYLSYLFNVDGVAVRVSYSGPTAGAVTADSVEVVAAFETLDALIEAAEDGNWNGIRD